MSSFHNIEQQYNLLVATVLLPAGADPGFASWAFSTTPLLFRRPIPSELPGYIFAADSVGLSSFQILW